jgi:aspartyl-tRNA(Asn)/glutamyl-tRNA(Gln) amidotransferase subunit B
MRVVDAHAERRTMNHPATTIIGLEVHVQLSTESKLFCRCNTRFGEPPNTQVCPICLGMPGTLPVMNRRALELALKTGAALEGTIAKHSKWDRKQYYYPDLPKGYQISQYDLPLVSGGRLEISDSKDRFTPKSVGIIRVHLEEDAGKSMHDERESVGDSQIDLNRAGTPLLEIVTCPDIRSPLEAKAFLTELKLLLTYLEVSDCNMQEGSLRVDANINLHIESPDGRMETPIVEVKNMNSFRAVERALAYEAERQYDAWRETGRLRGDVPKQTRGWDDQAGVTHAQRHKEESSDYRYFPDPDLVPVVVSSDEVGRIRAAVGELPAALRRRLAADYGISAYDSDVLVNQGRDVVKYFEQVARECGDGKLASNWIQQDVLRTLKESLISIDDFTVTAQSLGELLRRVQVGSLDTSRAREVLGVMIAEKVSVDHAIRSRGIEEVGYDELVALCKSLLEEHPAIVSDVKAGKVKAAGALVGLAKKRNPNVNPNQIREICLGLIEAL